MILTQIELDEIKKQVSYDPDTGVFTYTSDKYLERRYSQEMAVAKAPKISHRQGDRADKIYANKYVGVYVLKRVINAAHLALYFTTGHWPEAVKFKGEGWECMRADNLIAMTRSQQTTAAAQARYEGFDRKLPPNVYGTSSGGFIARMGNKRTREYESVREALQAIRLNRWLA